MLLLLVVIGLGAEVATLAQALDRLNRGTAILQKAGSTLGADPNGWTAERISVAAGFSNEADGLIRTGAERISGDPILRALGLVPLVGDQAIGLRDLADASVRGSAAFKDTLAVASAVDQTRKSTDPPGSRLLNLIAATGSYWTDTDANLTPALDAIHADMNRPLLPALAERVRKVNDQFQPVDDLARVGAVAARYLPDALGAKGSRTYLVLMANPTEIRPAGGFVGSVGVVGLAKGAPTTIDIKSQDAFYPQMKKHFDVPSPLGRYMKLFKDSLEIGDAGWDPDFPTSGKLSEQIYTSAVGPVDGTVSIDPYAIAALLDVTGPVDVPGYGTFSSSDFVPKLNYIVNVSTAKGSGKQALGPISNAVLNKILTAPASSWPRLLLAARQQADGRHIQVLFHDGQLEEAAASAHYDGAILPGNQDSLMAVDANVTPSKGDYYVQKSMNVKAEVEASGMTRHEVTMTYDMPTPVDDIDRALNPGDGTYRDYVRFYLPETATVANFHITLDGKPSESGLDAISYAHGREVVGAYFRLPRGHETVVDMIYEIPNAPQASYQLTVQKQAGVPGLPTTVLISYPGGFRVERSDLTTDMNASVTW